MSKRGELLKATFERGLSIDTVMLTSDILRNLTEEQREIKAGQILTILKNSKSEKDYLEKIKEM